MKVKRFLYKSWYRLTYRFRTSKIIVQQATFSGDHSFIDIRYWLSRPDKIQQKSCPYLINDKTQEKLSTLHLTKFGTIQTKLRKSSSTGIILFYNRNTSVKAGDSITLIWDSLTANSIQVQ